MSTPDQPTRTWPDPAGSAPARLAVLVLPALLMAGLSLARFWPELNLPFTPDPGDDWTFYHQRALEVLAGQWWLPGVAGAYTVPAGFLYIYFLAGCYALIGAPLPAWVYVIQGGLLGLSLGLIFLAFRRGLSPLARAVLLAALLVFGYLDMERHYVGRLLSENLLLFLAALHLHLLLLGVREDKPWARVLALALLGPLYLCRPNLMFYAPLPVIWLALRHRPPHLLREAGLAALMAGAALFCLAWRNHAAGGGWTVFPPIPWHLAVDNHLPTPWHWLDHPLEVARSLGLRALYALGLMPLMQPQFQWRPHWVAMWAAYVGVIILRRRRRGAAPSPELGLLHLYLAGYLLPIIGLAFITNYGFRFLVAGVLPAIAGAARIVDLLRPAHRTGQA
ncbi:MAG: hypothetical protein V1797_07040 [Pseudomonadota bacterium]